MPAGDQPDKRARRQAVALRYDPETDGAPFVAASGRGLLAERIVAIAREKGVPIHHDPELTAALGRLRLNEEIPPELYSAVARILAYILHTEGLAAGRERD